jgi:aryl-alcohol dehydrogenase-like predicted oxidoreductase
MCLTDSNIIYLYLVQADHYGPAEPFVGQYRAREGKAAEQQQFYTKWVPRPEKMSRDKIDAAIQRSLTRMNTDRLDLMQFHWWDYQSPYYIDALSHMQVCSMYQQQSLSIVYENDHLYITLSIGYVKL